MSISSHPNSASALGPPAVPTDPIWRLTVEQYHEMIRVGILTEEDPVELLEGWLVPKMPKNPAHRTATSLVRKALEACVPAGWYVDSQEPITLASSEPEPDVAVVRGSPRDYAARHPGANDVALVVEVADTTLDRDKTSKKRVYAQAGVLEYWIVNLPDLCVEVYGESTGSPGAEDYGRRHIYQRGDAVPLRIAGAEVARIAVRDMLP